MTQKHKLAYMGLGGMLMLIGMIAAVAFMPNLVAQNLQTFDQIKCKRLEIVDGDGNVTISFSNRVQFFHPDENGDYTVISNYEVGSTGQIQCSNVLIDGKNDGTITVARLGQKNNGDGALWIFNKDGVNMASISTNADGSGGVLNTFNRQEKATVVLGTYPESEQGHGGLWIHDKNGNTTAQLNTIANGSGAALLTYDKRDELTVLLGTHPEHADRGVFELYRDGKTMAHISIGDFGGAAVVRAYSGEGKAAIGIGPDNSGFSSTTDVYGR